MTAVYSYDYSAEYQPPIPMVDLAVGVPLSETIIELQAIVDSGADATMVPVHYLQEVGAQPTRKAIMRGVSGKGTLVDLYAVGIRLGPYRQGYIEVIGVPDGEETIIGRDLINHLSVTLNGPAVVVELN